MNRGVVVAAAVALGGLALDLWSKGAAFALVPEPRDRIAVVDGFFYLAHVRNPGMAWSLFQGVDREIWVAVRTGLSLGLLWLYRSTTRRGAPWWSHVAFGCLLGGALGNLYDNVFALDGHVRDFLLFYFWGKPFPVFNVADAMITIGAPALFLHLARHERLEAAAAREEAARRDAEARAAVAAAQVVPPTKEEALPLGLVDEGKPAP